MPASPVLILYGPTASGKTALAVKLALAHGAATIINADSMQLYRGMPILTACPAEREKQGVPHRLFEWRDPALPCSAAQWVEAARIAIYEEWQQGRLPILVGGTGLYLKALMEGLSAIPDISATVRDRVRALSTEAAHRQLQQSDAAEAERLNPGDSQRVKRALEVVLETGKPLAYWQAQPNLTPLPEADFQLHVLEMPREQLYARCNARLEQMIQQGALEELQSLLDRQLSPDLPAMRAVGVPELAAHLRGELSLDEALANAQQATRRYAKRQMTWARNQFATAPRLHYPYEPLPKL